MAESLDDQVELVKHLTAGGRAFSAQTYPEFAAAIAKAVSATRGSTGDQGQPYGQAVAQAILDHLVKNGTLAK